MQPTIFDVRIPTYDRPKMLRRALDSLRGQTYTHWKATVFDDSESSESREVVEGVADERIIYFRNPRRLGAAANIDQCFSPFQFADGDYGCVLEDDNFWLPDFLSHVVSHLKDGRTNLVLANQRINEEGAGLQPETETTRGRWFCAGTVTPLYLRATLLFMEGLSNGGLVWRLGGDPDLRVGPQVRETGLHEGCRSLLVKSPFLFIENAQAVWTMLPRSDTARATERNRVFGRGMQSIRDFVLRTHGESVVEVAKSLALRLGLTTQLVEALSYSGFAKYAGELFSGRRPSGYRALVKGKLIRLVERDPCADFLKNPQIAILNAI
jgi:hypothetical protein